MQMRHDSQTAITMSTSRLRNSSAGTSQLCTVITSFTDIYLNNHGRIMILCRDPCTLDPMNVRDII